MLDVVSTGSRLLKQSCVLSMNAVEQKQMDAKTKPSSKDKKNITTWIVWLLIIFILV